VVSTQHKYRGREAVPGFVLRNRSSAWEDDTEDIHFSIYDELIEEVRRLGKHKTRKEAMTAALEEYVRRLRQRRILAAFGTVDFDPEYDYKAERKRKRMG